MAEKPRISLKLHINTKANRVLFAEVEKDFVDFLSHMLSLPLSTENGWLREQGMTVGSISNLHSSIQTLDVSYMQQETKDAILNPRLFQANDSISYVPQFFPNIFFSSKELRKCPGRRRYTNSDYLSGKKRRLASINTSESSSDGGFVKGIVTYIVMDNLELRPMSGISFIKNLLDELDLKNFALLQEKVVNMGMDEAAKLLRSSLRSQTVLTDVFLKT